MSCALVLLGMIVSSAWTQAQHVHSPRVGARILPLPKQDGVFHFVVFGDRTGGPKEGIRVLEQAVRDTNLLAPDLVMTVGDLIEGYNQRKEWMEQMREFRGVMDRLDCAWFPVAGNHDIYWRGDGRPEREHEANYEKHFGPLWYWFEHKDCAFFVLYTDEGDPKDGSKGFRLARHTQMSKKQLAWLRKELAKTKTKKHVFVFCHHPRWIKGRYEGNNWNAVHAALREAGNVRAVFGGHIHRMHYAGKRDGIEYITLATTGGHLSGTIPGAGMLHHLNVVTVREDRISHATLPVGAVMDPKRFSPAYLAQIDSIRKLQPRIVKRLAVDRRGGALGVQVIEVTNPATRPIEVALGLDAGERWAFGPDHAHAKIAAGKTKRFEFACAREPIGFRGLVQPTVTLQVDWLDEGYRVSLPETRRPLPLILSNWPPKFFDPLDRGALVCDGRRACVEVPATEIALPDGPITVECWMRPNSMKGRRGLITKAENSEFGIFVNNGQPAWIIHLDGAYREVKGREGQLRSRVWQHVAGVYDGREVRLYVDGRLVGKAPAKGKRTRNHLSLIVGGDIDRWNRPTSYFDGEIDEVRISTVARYTAASFEPAQRHKPDGDTKLLLHLDKWLGPWAPDHSAKRAHGLKRGNARVRRADVRGGDEQAGPRRGAR